MTRMMSKSFCTQVEVLVPIIVQYCRPTIVCDIIHKTLQLQSVNISCHWLQQYKQNPPFWLTYTEIWVREGANNYKPVISI